MRRKALALGLALSLAISMGWLAASVPAHADSHGIARETDDLTMLWDLLVVRPVAIAAMAAGAIVYIPASLITAAGNNDMKPIEDAFLRKPYKFAIERPLGEFGGD